MCKCVLFFICSQSPGHPFVKPHCHQLPSEKTNLSTRKRQVRVRVRVIGQLLLKKTNKQLKMNTVRIITKRFTSPLGIGPEQTMNMMGKEEKKRTKIRVLV